MCYVILKEVQKQAEGVLARMSECGGCRGRLMGKVRGSFCCGDILHLGPGNDYTEGATVEWSTGNVYTLFFRLQFKNLRENLVGNPKIMAATPC